MFFVLAVIVLSVSYASGNFIFISRSLRKMLKKVKPCSSLCESLLESSTGNHRFQTSQVIQLVSTD